MSQRSPEEASAETAPAPAAPETASSAVPDDEDDLWECLDKIVAEVSFYD